MILRSRGSRARTEARSEAPQVPALSPSRARALRHEACGQADALMPPFSFSQPGSLSPSSQGDVGGGWGRRAREQSLALAEASGTHSLAALSLQNL